VHTVKCRTSTTRWCLTSFILLTVCFPFSHSGLAYHMRTHEKSAEVVCSRCGQRFQNKGTLNRHQSSASCLARRVYQFSALCGTKFASQKLVKKHQRYCKRCAVARVQEIINFSQKGQKCKVLKINLFNLIQELVEWDFA